MDDLSLPTPAFDLDQALGLEAAGPGVWRSLTDGRYWNAIGPWGGWTAGLLLKAVLSEPEARAAPVAMTVNLMGGLSEGALEVRTRSMRQGRSVGFWTSELIQDGQAAAMAMVTMGERRETFRSCEAVFPEAPAPESLPQPERRGGPAFGAMFDNRLVSSAGFFAGADSSRTLSWVRDAGHRPLDEVLLAGLADIFLPRTFLRMTQMHPISTVSMNVYFHATAEEIRAVGDDFLLCEAQARSFSNGFYDQVGTIWSRTGVLLATTEQLCWFK